VDFLVVSEGNDDLVILLGDLQFFRLDGRDVIDRSRLVEDQVRTSGTG
jgi:hypothetical protein